MYTEVMLLQMTARKKHESITAYIIADCMSTHHVCSHNQSHRGQQRRWPVGVHHMPDVPTVSL